MLFPELELFYTTQILDLSDLSNCTKKRSLFIVT